MMPSPAQLRNKRIKKLVEYGKESGLLENWVNIYDSLFTKAKKLYPTVARNTLQTYARAAYSILESERNP